MTKVKTISLFLSGLLLSALPVELGLRLIESSALWRLLPVAEVALYGPDPATGYALRPNVSGIWATENRSQVTINALGLRDAPMTRDKPAGTRRIGVVGDSITEALQVQLDETFTQRTERRFENLEMVNMGLSGATPAVTVERARSLGPELGLDALLVVMSWRDLGSPLPDDDSAFPGYRPDGQGGATISHRFRDTLGYRIRTSATGEWIYSALDTLRIARIVNSRRNVGMLHEWRMGDTPAARDACAQSDTPRLTALTSQPPSFAQARLKAFVDDLASLGIPVIVVLRELASSCAGDEVERSQAAAALLSVMASRLDAAVDMDAELAAVLPAGVPLSDLKGFGTRIGHGHLNERGHAAYSEVLTDLMRRRWPGIVGR